MSSTIIIITKPPQNPTRAPNELSAGDTRTYALEGYEDATDYEILMAAAAQIESDNRE